MLTNIFWGEPLLYLNPYIVPRGANRLPHLIIYKSGSRYDQLPSQLQQKIAWAI